MSSAYPSSHPVQGLAYGDQQRDSPQANLINNLYLEGTSGSNRGFHNVCPSGEFGFSSGDHPSTYGGHLFPDEHNSRFEAPYLPTQISRAGFNGHQTPPAAHLSYSLPQSNHARIDYPLSNLSVNQLLYAQLPTPFIETVEYHHGPQQRMPRPATAPALPTRSTLRISRLEPWMDVDHFNQICGVMGWENVILKIPQPGTYPYETQIPHNPGYCFMTFPTPAIAQSVLVQFTAINTPSAIQDLKRSLSVSWATIPVPESRGDPDGGLFVPGSLSVLNPYSPPVSDVSPNTAVQQEYSIFVGDLAPETTNSDLIAVFRDPILGLRHDREPKFVAPFTSCKSAKIMVDPVVGVSKGYGFVRFASASDASRALIEMQGLYCLSRPMRISQATAKTKPTAVSTSPFLHARQSPASMSPFSNHPSSNPSVNSRTGRSYLRDRLAPEDDIFPAVVQGMTNFYFPKNTDGSDQGTPSIVASFSTNEKEYDDPIENLPPETVAALSALNVDRNLLSRLLKLARTGSDQLPSSPNRSPLLSQTNNMRQNYQTAMHSGSKTPHAASRSYSQSAAGTSAKSKCLPETEHQRAQARALLINMIGSNGGLLNSTDPYNTTVFVGGLSGLISEDTLRTFFGPFGEIHYVKIPPGKGCGFVQFVRKADAELAIEKMQGFPIGGGRVRLSWGRSQSDKAAQAAAQAAELGLNLGQLGSLQGLSESHTAQLLQSLGLNTDIRQDEPQGTPPRPTNANASSASIPLPDAPLSRSQTFPSFAPFGVDAGTIQPSRSISGNLGVLQVHHSGRRNGTGIRRGSHTPQLAPVGQYTPAPGASEEYPSNLSKQPVVQIDSSDGLKINYTLYQERSGSSSTVATTASQVTPPPAHENLHELNERLSWMNLNHGSGKDTHPVTSTSSG